MQNQLLQDTREALKRAQGKELEMLIGLDGFVDEIIHVVDTREDFEKFTRINTIAEFGGRITKAAGLSANIEFVPVQTKLGGNGPIFANALLDSGAKVTYIGAIGAGSPHPVFAPLTERAKVYAVCAPGTTDALEFSDGKLMFGKHSSLREITWENVLKTAGGLENFTELAKKADLLGMENWTMLPHMSEVFEGIIKHVLPALPDKPQKPIAFFDLADPEKRLKQDIEKALRLIADFESKYYTVLGLNEKEAYEIADVLGVKYSKACDEELKSTVHAVYDKLGISCLAVHPTKFAVAVDKNGYNKVDGPYCAAPKLTTGAGDNFNAGFCLGLSLGFDTKLALATGVATSGFYVRNARSPKRAELIDFIDKWLNMKGMEE